MPIHRAVLSMPKLPCRWQHDDSANNWEICIQFLSDSFDRMAVIKDTSTVPSQ